MYQKIIEFVSLLRDAKVRISVSETIDCCKSLQLINIVEKNSFKTILCSNLIKEEKDLPIFNKIFDLFFIDIELEKDKIQTDDIPLDLLENDFFNQEGISEYTIEDNINNVGFETEVDVDNLINQCLNSLNFTDDFFDVEKYCNMAISGCKITTKEISDITNDMVTMDEFKEKLKHEIEKKYIQTFGQQAILELLLDEDLYNKDLSKLTLEEVKKVNEIIKQMAKKIVVKQSRRKCSSKKGYINIKKTIQKSLKNNNFSELKFQKNKKTKSKLIVLCDISGSVKKYVEFFLKILFSISIIFDDVLLYVFVDKIKNITEDINNLELNYQLGYGTDYENVFKEFNDEIIFDKKTTLIIVGDAENTSKQHGNEYLTSIRNKVKSIYWFNPKNKEDWFDNYSCLNYYQVNCKKVLKCSTLYDLENSVKELLK